MEVSEYLSALRSQGDLFAAAAEKADLDVPVPTCPAWRMRDLIRHLGGVHRWAAAHVRERLTERAQWGSPDAAGITDEAIVDWFREGLAALARTLETADPDLMCWTFLPAPSPLAFWARRQALETSIHRADAESVRGTITPYPAALAVDGIEELLCSIVPARKRSIPVHAPRTLHLHATDADGEWVVVMGQDGIETRREHAKADCAVRATASDLFLLVWNRLTADGLEAFGDATLLDVWRQHVHV